MILGIDCGLSGALGWVDPVTGEVQHVTDMPVFEVLRGKKKRHDLDIHTLASLIGRSMRPQHAFVEQAQAMPKQSAYAAGIFFQVYGSVLGVLAGAGIPYTIVHPATWKKAMGVPSDKDACRARASQLFPSAAGHWARKKDDGRAEAVLIADYGRRHFNTIASGLAA